VTIGREQRDAHAIDHAGAAPSDVIDEPVSSTRYTQRGAIPPVAPLHDQAQMPSASQRAYGEVAAAEDDAGPTGDRFAGSGPLHDVEGGARTLKLGAKGAAVRRLQQALIDLNYAVAVTGTYDQGTADAVKDYQHKNKLAETGELDGTTFTKLEHEFFDRSAYAKAAGGAPPGVHDTPKGTDAKDEPVLLSQTRTLDADDKAAANAAISPSQASGPIGTFVESTSDGHYGARIEKALTATIASHYKSSAAEGKKHEHESNLFSKEQMYDVGNAAKGQVDQVFGSWAVGGKMDKTTLKDRFEVDTAHHKSLDADKKREAAKSRAEYFMNTRAEFERIDHDHSADRTRAAEHAIIAAVLDRVAAAHTEELLVITADWSAATDRRGIIKIQRFKSGEDAQDRATLWQKFGTMVHEYIHSLAHPKWREYKELKAQSDSQAGTVLTEGVTELLTRAVLSKVNFADKQLQHQVLGKLDDGSTPDFDRSGYEAAMKHAEALVGVVGIHNLYAAYFLGETSLVGA
jgi:peptidoglycan hydrolase-like protein with peptidoglycan-binding domain